jgi:transcriptional regulator with XRE-family HTH domain
MQKTVAEKYLKHLGQRIRALRHAQSLSQEELADRAGIHVTYLSALEGGKRNPSMGIFFSIADALKVTPSELIRFTSQEEQHINTRQRRRGSAAG